jgi:DNA-binding MarR family transcriptional regulator
MRSPADDILTMAREADAWLRAVQQALRRPMEREVARGGITGPQLNVLQAAIRAPGITLKALCEEIGLAHSTVSGIVDRLAARGLVERRRDLKDGRVSRIYPAASVTHYVEKHSSTLRLHPLAEALGALSPEGRRTAMAGLRLIASALGALG